MTKRERRRLSDDGLPKDAREWTAEMWAILHRHTEDAKLEIREHYEQREKANGPDTVRTLPPTEPEPVMFGVPDVPTA